MADVVLLPTGKMEHAGLVPALSALFPEVEFVVEPPDEPLTGFTSTDVRRLPAPQEFTEVSELAARLVAAVKPGRRGKRPTFAVAIDDLELVNDPHPAEVIAYFRRAVIEHVERVWRPPADANSDFNLVRECCSFHLFRPMTEAYFFGEPAALQRASVQRPSQLVDGLDFENFETTDSDYHALPAKSARIPDMRPCRSRQP